MHFADMRSPVNLKMWGVLIIALKIVEVDLNGVKKWDVEVY